MDLSLVDEEPLDDYVLHDVSGPESIMCLAGGNVKGIPSANCTGRLMTERFRTRGIWVTELINLIGDRTVDRPIVISLVTLGAIPIVLTGLFFGLVAGPIPLRFTVAQILAMSVAVVGPAAIWYWDECVFPTFVADTADIVERPAELTRLAERYHRIFRERFWLFTLVWTLGLLAILLVNLPYFRTLGIAGPLDPAFITYLLFGMGWGIITGIGFHGAFTAIRCLYAVGQLDFEIEPLHPDGLGGLSAVGTLAIRTTMLISVGSLTLPLAFIFAAEGGFSVLVYLAVGLYALLIFGSFVFPTVYFNRRALDIRACELDDKRKRIRELEAAASEPAATGGDDQEATIAAVTRRLEIQRLRDEYNEYNSVNLYPLSIGIIVRLVSSVLLPIAFTVFDIYLGRVL